MMLLLLVACLAFVQGGTQVAWNSRIPNIVPQVVFDHLQAGKWGDFHQLYHMTRKWYQIGSEGRAWLKSKNQVAAAMQEGFPGNGMEFLCMHRAMIEHLRSKFGSVPVSNHPGKRTFGQVLDGWNNDDLVFEALEKKNARAATAFDSWLDQINDFQAFRSEDDFANYLQTDTRPGVLPPHQMLTTDGTPAKRAFTTDQRVGAGVHNWLHMVFQEGRVSPIDVGNAQLNLGNNVFWAIHGWIEAKWKDFEAGHRRTPAEQAVYTQLMTRYRSLLASRNGAVVPPHVPTSVAQNVRPVLLSNEVDCSRLTPHTVTDECPQGRTNVQTTPRVNNGTVCVIDTQEVKAAQTTLIQRGHLAPFTNGHPGNDGVWGPSSQAALTQWLAANRLPAARCLTRSVADTLKALRPPTRGPTTPRTPTN